MGVITEWVKTILIFYFLMLIVLNLIPGEQYKRYVRFFTGIVFAIMLMQPVLQLLGKEGELMDIASSESFFLDMTSAGMDAKLWEKEENKLYRKQYEKALGERFTEEGRREGFLIAKVGVCLKDDYSIERISITEELPGEGEEFFAYLNRAYGIERGSVMIQ